jgi:hypothetical protein
VRRAGTTGKGISAPMEGPAMSNESGARGPGTGANVGAEAVDVGCADGWSGSLIV